MRMGVKDYLLKKDIASRVFPQSLLRIIEKGRLVQELMELEIKKKRLEAMQEIVCEYFSKDQRTTGRYDQDCRID